MKLVFEAYVSIFIICVCALLCVCLVSANLGVANARDAYTTYATQLQNSNFADSVVQACKSDALSRGYSINIMPDDIDGDGDRSGSIELQYEYRIAIIGYSTQRVIRGYLS